MLNLKHREKPKLPPLKPKLLRLSSKRRPDGRINNGRPFFEPTDEQRAYVEALTAFGIPQEHICEMVINNITGKPITKPTLEKYFASEIKLGLSKMISELANHLYTLGTTPGPSQFAAIQFALRTRGRWRDINNIELTGKDGGPIETADKTEYSDEERAIRIASILAAARARGAGQITRTKSRRD